MRTVATALVWMLAASAIDAAAEAQPAPPSAVPHGISLPPPSSGAPAFDAGKSRELHASLPDRPRARAENGRPPRGRTCFNQAETREKILSFRLSDPLHALKLGRTQGDALSAKLCRWSADQFVYEIHVLRSDGRVLRVYMNAQNGEAVGDPNIPARDKERN